MDSLIIYKINLKLLIFVLCTNTTTVTTTIGLEKTISLPNNDKNNLKGYKNIAFWTGYSGKLQNWLSVFNTC
ncbi:hypothetical protein Anas_11610 [Armadillidium nasatum]|uniref:Uncharacterized protein n=1 Tax=Armadillidium nasatum TaxID=96803 RepID=A0A5N5SPC7_9CRUS|nr:hypothetical protein Anas_11610 [Armadillidium nasatum]